ncbi:ATP-binding protein [Nocardioides zeae]|uniref:ATP-binding protein n=1 Tax=Nocardioides imazamoxiresistens TaxID=3231893 RepID=A0ABU3PYT2_9ACTN|nr:ATP-binding protein [Nocardioides zeae]MDT9594418.1 ATP-binding protein [Nocardioides zeae]
MVATPAPEPVETGWHAVELPHSDDAARSTCAVIRDDLAALHLSPRALNDAIIVAGELVINAVEHGTARADGTISLLWSLAEEHLVVRVVDAGCDGEITVGALSSDGLRGRGLAMVASICDEWSVNRAAGTTITARIPL